MVLNPKRGDSRRVQGFAALDTGGRPFCMQSKTNNITLYSLLIGNFLLGIISYKILEEQLIRWAIVTEQVKPIMWLWFDPDQKFLFFYQILYWVATYLIYKKVVNHIRESKEKDSRIKYLEEKVEELDAQVNPIEPEKPYSPEIEKEIAEIKKMGRSKHEVAV